MTFRPARYAFRFDDLHPGMDREAFLRARTICDAHGIKALVAVIPDNRDASLEHDPHDPGFWDLVRELQADGWTVAMHGTTHAYVSRDAGLVGVNAYSEFAGLPYEEQRAKVAEGKRLLAAQGIETDVFVAPGHSFDAVTCRALADEEFRFVSDGIALWSFDAHGVRWIPQPAWKPRAFPFGDVTFCFHTDTFADRDFDRFAAFAKAHGDAIVPFSALMEDSSEPGLARRLVSRAFRAAFFARRLIKLGRFANQKELYDTPGLYDRRSDDPVEGYLDRAYLQDFLGPWIEDVATGEVADLGAGTGALIPRMTRAKRVHAVELSGAMLDIARQRLAGDRRVVFLEEDATRTSLGDASMDSVVSVGMLGYVDVDAQIAELARIARPGARVLVTTPNLWNPFNLLVHVRDLALGRRHGKRFLAAGDLRRRFARAGFEVVRTDSRAPVFWVPGFMRRAVVPAYVLLDRLWRPLQGVLPIGTDVCLELRR